MSTMISAASTSSTSTTSSGVRDPQEVVNHTPSHGRSGLPL
ncbi:hypothetical protein [Streptomyces sp. NPDC058667]